MKEGESKPVPSFNRSKLEVQLFSPPLLLFPQCSGRDQMMYIKMMYSEVECRETVIGEGSGEHFGSLKK